MVEIKGVRRVQRRPVHEADEDADEPRAGWWADEAGDGWNTKDEPISNIVDWCGEVVDLKYELDNARRGAYAIRGDTPEALLQTLQRLLENLEGLVGDLEGQIE